MKTIKGALGQDPKPQRLSPGVYRNAQGQLSNSKGRPQAGQPQMQGQGAMPQQQPSQPQWVKQGQQMPPQMQGGGGYGMQQMPQPPANQGWQQGAGGGWSNPMMFAQQQQMNPMQGQQQGFQGVPRFNFPAIGQGQGGYGYGVQGQPNVNDMSLQQRNPNYTQGR